MPEYDSDAREKGYCAYIGDGRDYPCRLVEGWGYPNATSGLCDHHGERGGQEGNSNAVGNEGGDGAEPTHGAYMDEFRFYDDHISDSLRELVDDIYADYYAEFTALHGEPLAGEDVELFRLANTHVKDIVLNNWSADRPDSLAESGNPLVDRETHVSESGREYYRYKESVVIAAQQKLSRDRLRWLKAYDLDRSTESDAADSLTDLATAMMETLQGEYGGGDAP